MIGRIGGVHNPRDRPSSPRFSTVRESYLDPSPLGGPQTCGRALHGEPLILSCHEGVQQEERRYYRDGGIMSAQKIGRVKSGKSRKSYEVKWDSGTKQVYVSYAGWTNCGSASSASDAMRRAEAFLYAK